MLAGVSFGAFPSAIMLVQTAVKKMVYDLVRSIDEVGFLLIRILRGTVALLLLFGRYEVDQAFVEGGFYIVSRALPIVTG